MNIKIGDKIAYIKYDTFEKLVVGWGYIFYIDENEIKCIRDCNPIISISHKSFKEKYFIVDSDTKNNMINVINSEIDNLKLKISELTENQKNELRKTGFDKIKNQIIKTAEHMINSDEEEFINKLKSICSLKQQLFSIKISSLDNTINFNKLIKNKINKLKILLNSIDELTFE